LRKARGSPLAYLRITLEDAIIPHVKSAMNLNMDMPRENISLSFSRVRYEYTLSLIKTAASTKPHRCSG